MRLPLDGRCRCDRVRLRITAPPLLTMACHCTGCQRMSSSAYSLSAAIPSEAFTVTQGEPVIGGLHDPRAQHFFCGWCMTWMFTRPAGMDHFVNLRPTMLDDTSWYVPFIETWASEKLPWVAPVTKHTFDRLPEMHEFAELTRAYQATL